jgi:hypothetical protein
MTASSPELQPTPTKHTGPWHNLDLKLLALVFAALVWIYINREITTQTELLVPVRLSSPSPLLLVTRIEPSSLRLILDGPKERLAYLKPSELATNFSLAADVLAESESRRVLSLAADEFFQLPPGIQVTNRLPAIQVQLLRASERTLRITPTIVGAPASGYRVGTLSLEPSEIRLRGPAEAISKLDTISTEPIDITGRSAKDSPLTTFVELQTRFDGHTLENIDNTRIRIQLELLAVEQRGELRLPARKIYLAAPADFPYVIKHIELAQIDIVIEAPLPATAQTADLARVFIVLDQFEAAILAEHHKNLHYPLQVSGLPPGCRILRYETEVDGAPRTVEKIRISMEQRIE